LSATVQIGAPRAGASTQRDNGIKPKPFDDGADKHFGSTQRDAGPKPYPASAIDETYHQRQVSRTLIPWGVDAD
jgi:hypothetical protein